jgi:hypothetical protein
MDQRAKGPRDRRPSCMIAALGREVKGARWANAARPLQVGPKDVLRAEVYLIFLQIG